MSEFHIGDAVEILMKDGAVFRGFLEDFTEHYVVLSGLGYAMDDIVTMQPWSC